MARQNDTVWLRAPAECTVAERAAFAALVRRGFGPAPDDRAGRISVAECLAFHYTADTLTGVAALKAPDAGYRADVFAEARTGAAAAAYPLELGWVFVPPDLRGRGIGAALCQPLLVRGQGTGTFATTRPDNAPMIRILEALGFGSAGAPYRRGSEELLVFLRRAAGR